MGKKLVNKITIVGCGPGSRKHLTGLAMQRIKSADSLIGSRRLLELFPDIECDKYTVNRNYRLLIMRIISLSKRKKVVVLVSGDPGFFSYSKLIIDKVGVENCEIIPGISSVQLAFTSIGRTWNDACFVSLHGRKSELPTLIKKVKEEKKVAVLTDKANNLKLIYKGLMSEGIRDRMVYVCEDLSLKTERIRCFKLTSIQRVHVRGLNVIIIVDEE